MVTPTVTTKVNNNNYDVSADQWNALIAAVKNQGYSYIVYKSGSTYYARNGVTGAVDYSSSNGTTVLQNAFNQGGRIFITGTISTIGGLTVDVDGTEIITAKGDPHHGIIDTSGSANPTLTVTADYVKIENLRIFRNPIGTGRMIYINNAAFGFYSNLYLLNTAAEGVYIENSSSFNTFENCIINVCNKGIVINASGTWFGNELNQFISTKIWRFTTSAVELYRSTANKFTATEIFLISQPVSPPNAFYIYGCRGTEIDNTYIGEGTYNHAIHIEGTEDGDIVEPIVIDHYLAVGTNINGFTIAGKINDFNTAGIYCGNSTTDTHIANGRFVYCTTGLLIESLAKSIYATTISVDNATYTHNAPPVAGSLITNNAGSELHFGSLQDIQKIFAVGSVVANQNIKKLMYSAYGGIQDFNIRAVTVTLEAAPGSGQSILVEVTDGTHTMSANITNTVNGAYITSNTFTWDVSSKALIIRYTSSATAATGLITVMIEGSPVYT